MDLATFIEQRSGDWRRLEAIVEKVEGSGLHTLADREAVEFGRLYRRAASDLNQAQTMMSSEATVQYLNELVVRCYQLIYRKSKVDVWAFFRYLYRGYPGVFRSHWRVLALAAALFAAGAVFGFWASYADPASRTYLLPSAMPTIQPGDESSADEAPLMTSGQLAGFSSFLFTHNLSVSLAAFALGITLGIGTAWMMFYNGVLLGALGAVFLEAHQFTAFATGVLPHGVLEIPAALIGGASGFLLARGLIFARPWSRLEELAFEGKEALFLVAGCVPLLAVAALLEGGVARAPDWFLSSGLKLAVAGIFALIFAAYVLLPGTGQPTQGSRKQATALAGTGRLP